MATRTEPRSRLGQAVLATLALLGVGHFVLGFLLMIPLIWSLPGYRVSQTIFSLPYAGLTVLFIASFVTALRDRLRLATYLLAAAFLLSTALCAYDLTHGERAQILGGGVGHTYLFWWWYYEPYWYGYKPGNV